MDSIKNHNHTEMIDALKKRHGYDQPDNTIKRKKAIKILIIAYIFRNKHPNFHHALNVCIALAVIVKVSAVVYWLMYDTQAITILAPVAVFLIAVILILARVSACKKKQIEMETEGLFD